MIILLSPAKKMDFDALSDYPITVPQFLNHAQTINDTLGKLTATQISQLQHISTNLAQLNFERNQQWQNSSEGAKSAIFSFNGDVYVGLDAQTLLPDDLDFAQQKLRILSGLYGWLKPFDGILPYRLEMGTNIPIQEAKNLYQFWQNDLTQQLINETKAQKTDFVLNLASSEYAKAIDWKKIAKNHQNIQVVNPVFKDWKNKEYKIISFYAKKARGLMARFAIENRIEAPAQLKAFNYDGYTWNEQMSDAQNNWVFTRNNQ